MLSSKHRKSKRCSTRLRKTGTAALARRGAVAAGRSSGGSGPAGGRASAIRESLGPATGRGRTKGAAEGRARRAQAAPEDSRPAAHRTRTAARAGSAGIRNQFVVGLARGRPDRTGMWRTLQSFAGLAHPAATGLELPASRGTGPRAGRGQDSGVESEALGGD